MSVTDKLRIANLEDAVKTLQSQLDRVIASVNTLVRKTVEIKTIPGLEIQLSLEAEGKEVRVCTSQTPEGRAMLVEHLVADESGAKQWKPIELTTDLADSIDQQASIAGFNDGTHYYATFFLPDDAIPAGTANV